MTLTTVERRVRPASYEDAARALRDADEAGLAVVPWGAGAQQYVGNPPRRVDLVMETTSLSGIVEHTPADLTVTVAAGTRFADLQASLARAGQRLPLDPPHADEATVGGLVATNASGPRRQRHGTLRDLVIGTRTALVDGTLARAGGKVVKNVAGYDLNKLLIGSLGTIGVIVEVTCKVLPRPALEEAIVATFGSLREAVAAGTAVARAALVPSAIEAHDLDGAPRLVVAAEGDAAPVRRILDEATKLARDGGAREVEHHDEAEPLLARSRTLVARATEGAVLRASLPLAACPPFADELRRVARARGCAIAVAAHAGVGIVRAHLSGDVESLRRALVEALALAGPLEGDAYVERLAEPALGRLDLWNGEPPAFFLMRRIKQEFDPRGTLNPGRFVGGI